MADTNLSDILSQAPDLDEWGNVKRPKPIPAGLYTTQIIGLPRFDKSSKKQTPYVEFQHKFLEVNDDNVNMDELAAILGDRNLTDIVMRNTFYITPNSMWRLDQFLKDLGLGVDVGDSRQQLIESTAGRTVTVQVIHEPSDDGSTIFARISGTVADA